MPLSRTLIKWCFMPVQTREDRFANLAAAVVTEATPGTLTYAELLTGISIGAGIGLLLDKIDYSFSIGTINGIILPTHYVKSGWFTSNNSVDFDFNDRRLVSMFALHGGPTVGTNAGSGNFIRQPEGVSFSPPLIIASPRLFLGVLGGTSGVAANVISRIYFRYQPLSDKEYLELAETFVLVG